MTVVWARGVNVGLCGVVIKVGPALVQEWQEWQAGRQAVKVTEFFVTSVNSTCLTRPGCLSGRP